MLRRDGVDRRVAEGLAVAEGSVRLDPDALLRQVVQRLSPIQEGVELDLVHGRDDRRVLEELFDVFYSVVRHADGLHQALLLAFLELQVCGDVLPRHGPVDQVQIEILRAQVPQRPLDLSPDGGRPVIYRIRPALRG